MVCEFVVDAFFILSNVSAIVPKGRFSVAFSEECFYLDAPSKQVRIDYTKLDQILFIIFRVREVFSIGSLDIPSQTNVVLSLKVPLEVIYVFLMYRR